ncbi:hypothetical protein BALCAV_0210950 [Alkalihalobacillus alcalophilus ATCC 27647 = CGMCC 1.3604]|nr:CYTH domain-containing protein [Alkalihalobacillus alcalophilus]KGA97319.1 hypothetical protein BALCAV_0210950 [Alkalihalobacillus alcalophilus ATCC 27647 = CGMCC 1.3604]MED1562502.1 CYTH domain-containing protein [Alkalihalobacillus alcalophilus]
MAKEVEIEVKSMLSKEGYQTLIKQFNLSENEAFEQENHYFDTKDFQLREKRSALRVREKNRSYTLTLKQPHTVGLLETHQPLTEQQFQTFRKQAKLPTGDVVNQLEELDIKIEELHYLGALQTKRLEIAYNKGSLCLDQSHYLDLTDYEIEFEGQTLEHANETLNTVLQSVQLHSIPAKNKVQRFFERKQLLKK